MEEVYYYSWPDWSWKSTTIASELEEQVIWIESYAMNQIRSPGCYSLSSYIEKERAVISESTADVLLFDRGRMDLIAYNVSHVLLQPWWEWQQLSPDGFMSQAMEYMFTHYYWNLIAFIIENDKNTQFFLSAKEEELYDRIFSRPEGNRSSFDKRLLQEKGLLTRYMLIYDILYNMLCVANLDEEVIWVASMEIIKFRTDQLD